MAPKNASSPGEGSHAGHTEKAQQLMKTIAENGHTFQHIMLYNSVEETGEAHGALEQMKELHSNLLTYHAFMCGFQFIGISGWEPRSDTDQWVVHATLVLLSLGFLCSAFGSIFSFIALEFYGGMKSETSELIVAGVIRYWKIFYLSDLLGFLSTSLFLSGVLCMIHDSLPFTVCVVIDIVGGVAGVCVVAAHYLVIIAKQEYADGSPTPPTRKIFKHGKKALV